MLYKEQIATTKPLVYAQGVLAMLSVKESDFKDGIFILNSKSIEKIAIANNRTAPYGVAAKEALESAGLYTKLKHKFVYAESISQTVSYTMHGADIGLIAKSSLFSPQMAQYKENIHWIEVDSSLYTAIDQGIVILKNRNVEVDAFYNFMLGTKAKDILKKYGYKIPKQILHGK
jgi:molybdate transport system substrate-binding protein